MRSSCVIIGGGPSAKGITRTKIPDSYDVICLNQSAMRIKHPNKILFSADLYWINNNIKEIEKKCPKRIFAIPHASKYPGGNTDYLNVSIPIYTYVCRKPGVGVSDDGSFVYFGDNTGFAALNWANIWYDYVILVGYDLNESGGHWHKGYHNSIAERKHRTYTKWARSFDEIADDLSATVVNTSLDSAIKNIPYAPLKDAL